MRPLALLSTALCCSAVLSCSTPPATNNTVDAGEQPDIVEAGAPEVITAGFGNVLVTWTVNGMPPETGCAAAGAANVRLQVYFGRPETVPCTQGRFEARQVSATVLNVGADLLRADGSAIYAYNIETTVQANQTNNVTVPFEPTGSLRVRWTVNGQPASAECANVGGYDVRLEGRRLTAPARPPTCRAGQYTFSGLQPGEWAVSADLTRLRTPTMLARLTSANGSATVPSGGTGEVALDFTAEPLRDQ